MSGAPPRYLEREVSSKEGIASESATRFRSLHRQKEGTTYEDPEEACEGGWVAHEWRKVGKRCISGLQVAEKTRKREEKKLKKEK